MAPFSLVYTRVFTLHPRSGPVGPIQPGPMGNSAFLEFRAGYQECTPSPVHFHLARDPVESPSSTPETGEVPGWPCHFAPLSLRL